MPTAPTTTWLDTLLVWLLTPVYFLFIITIIATIHEYGHFIIAKLLGVRVDEFSIGFGKLLFSRKWGETEYNLRAIPIAAYVRPAGMDPAEEEQEGWVDPGERSFNKKNSLVKYAILFGGSFFNMLSTIVFLTMLYMYAGSGDSTVLVKSVSPNGPADVAGVRVDDVFVKMDGQPIKDAERAIGTIKSRPGQKIPIEVLRGGQTLTLTLIPEDNDGEGRIGIGFEPKMDKDTLKPMEFWPALVKAKDKTWDSVYRTYTQALKMFSNSFSKKEIPKDVGGPVSIVGAVGSQVKRGMTIPDLLWILAMLSLAIGVFNLLPIPALDGGRILVLFVRDVLDLGYTIVFRKRPPESLFSHRIEELVHLVGIIALLLLLVLVTFKDVRELVRPSPPPQMPVYPSPGASGYLPAPSASPSASPR
jgi:regulator of sigma E protease